MKPVEYEIGKYGMLRLPAAVAAGTMITVSKSVCSCPVVIMADPYHGMSSRRNARIDLFHLLHKLLHESPYV